MALQSVTRTQVIELARTIPISKLASWYEYGLFIQSRPPMVAAVEKKRLDTTDDELMAEIAAWEAASLEDWMNFENNLGEGASHLYKKARLDLESGFFVFILVELGH